MSLSRTLAIAQPNPDQHLPQFLMFATSVHPVWLATQLTVPQFFCAIFFWYFYRKMSPKLILIAQSPDNMSVIFAFNHS
jgi:hypothetical protein